MAQPCPRPDLAADGPLDLQTAAGRRNLFHADVRRLLDISGGERPHRWDVGAYHVLSEDTIEGRGVNDIVLSLLSVNPERVDAGCPRCPRLVPRPPAEENEPMAAIERIDPVDEDIVWVSPDEAWAYFDKRAQALLGMSGEEFLRRWVAGEFRGLEEDERGRAYNDLVMLATTIRPVTIEHGRIRFGD